MSLVIDVCLWICLGFIAYQDYKQRQISWYYLPLVFIAFVLKAADSIVMEDLIKYALFNLGFIVVQLSGLTIYMSLKNKKIINIVNTYLGIGDILFFVALCAAFSPVNFILFYVISMILTLIGFLVYDLIIKKAQKEIPLAGAMATVCIALLIINKIVPQLNFYNDAYLLSILNS